MEQGAIGCAESATCDSADPSARAINAVIAHNLCWLIGLCVLWAANPFPMHESFLPNALYVIAWVGAAERHARRRLG